MLIVYDTSTGVIVDNTGTSSAWPEGPPEELAYRNTDARGLDRTGLGLLRLHDARDAELIAAMAGHACAVQAGAVVIGDPLPPPPPAPDPVADPVAEATEAFVSAVESASTLEELKAALVGGSTGPGAAPRARGAGRP